MMANLFNQDFQEFIQALNTNDVKYILVGGYAVILHGYIRSTADMDIWVDKTEGNYSKLKKALNQFGAPCFSKNEFLGDQFNVWGIGREPNRIEIMSEVKGLKFNIAYKKSQTYQQENLQIKFIHLNDLLASKKAAGRFKDKNDIEQLNKKKKS
jgi:predicted nucleotidyltransferase